MGWVRIESAVFAHPKLGRVPKATRWVWVAGIAYANEHLTDGLVPVEQLRTIDANAKDARLLVAAGLWEPVDGGWQIHDYGQYQASRAEVQAGRAAARARMSRLRRNGGEFA